MAKIPSMEGNEINTYFSLSVSLSLSLQQYIFFEHLLFFILFSHMCCMHVCVLGCTCVGVCRYVHTCMCGPDIDARDHLMFLSYLVRQNLSVKPITL